MTKQKQTRHGHIAQTAVPEAENSAQTALVSVDPEMLQPRRWTSMDEIDGAHTSIRVSLPTHRCGEVREVIEVLSVLEEVYNHLYVWNHLVHQGDGHSEEGFHYKGHPRRKLNDVAEVAEAVPSHKRLCLARVEVNPPAFVEVVGAGYPLRVIHAHLAARGAGHSEKVRKGEEIRARELQRMNLVLGEINHLWGLNYPEAQIHEALSKHVMVPLERLDRLRRVELYKNDAAFTDPSELVHFPV